MRIWICACCLLVLLLHTSGCRAPRSSARDASKSSKPAAVSPEKPVVVPASDLNGRIARVNNPGRFVVMVFPVGQLPRMEQRLSVYRDGLKVAELKVTGPQLDDSVVADILAGEAREGDVVRE